MSAIYDARGIEVSEEDRLFAERVVTLGTGDGKHNTVNLAKRAIAEGVPGDFVEAGVNAGGHPALMAYAIRRYKGDGRKVHLYDSFEGVPRCGPEDPIEWRQIMGVNPDPAHPEACGRIVNPLSGVIENMGKWGADPSEYVIHKGWFQEVFPAETNTPKRISLLRIDVDLYDSTESVLEHLYPRVSSGGYVISDDWGEGEGMAPCRLATLRYWDRMGFAPPTVTRLPSTTGTVWWKKP